MRRCVRQLYRIDFIDPPHVHQIGPPTASFRLYPDLARICGLYPNLGERIAVSNYGSPAGSTSAQRVMGCGEWRALVSFGATL